MIRGVLRLEIAAQRRKAGNCGFAGEKWTRSTIGRIGPSPNLQETRIPCVMSCLEAGCIRTRAWLQSRRPGAARGGSRAGPSRPANGHVFALPHRREPMRKSLRTAVLPAALSAVALGTASSAMAAGPTGDYAKFQYCPYNNPAVE